MIEFISNGVDINVPDDYLIWVFFSKKTQMLQIKFFLIRSFRTLFEEQALSSDLLHPSGQSRVSVSQLVKPFNYLTKLSRGLLEHFGFKCNQLSKTRLTLQYILLFH